MRVSPVALLEGQNSDESAEEHFEAEPVVTAAAVETAELSYSAGSYPAYLKNHRCLPAVHRENEYSQLTQYACCGSDQNFYQPKIQVSVFLQRIRERLF